MATGFGGREKFLDRSGVLLCDQIRFGDYSGAVLQINETVGSGKIEMDFLRVHEMEYSHVMFPVAEMLKSISESLLVAEEVGEDHYESSLADFLCNGVQSDDESGFDPWLQLSENLEEVLEVGRTPAGGEFQVNGLIAA